MKGVLVAPLGFSKEDPLSGIMVWGMGEVRGRVVMLQITCPSPL